MEELQLSQNLSWPSPKPDRDSPINLLWVNNKRQKESMTDGLSAPPSITMTTPASETSPAAVKLSL